MALARRQVGKPYQPGGADPETGFDCSGLIQYLLHAMRIDVARSSKVQARAGEPVARDLAKLRVGDLLTFGYGSKVSHVGVYVGNGKFIHASSERHTVMESLLGRRATGRIKPWIGARRLLAFVSPATRDSISRQR
jgi:cell wall-associated NlpC family hydrolase